MTHRFATRYPSAKPCPIPSRAGLRPVQLRARHRAEIANRDRHSRSCSALRLAGYIGRRPGKHDRRRGVDACGGEDRADVRHARLVRGRREEDDVPDDGEAAGGDDERGAALHLLGQDGDDDCCERGHGVRRHGQELGLRCGIAQICDDGRMKSDSV